MDTYGSDVARDMTLSKLRSLLRDHGAKRLFIKHLAPNDNSKNQPYFGGDYSSLNVIPTGDIEVYQSLSAKKTGGLDKAIFRTSLRMSWVSPEGNIYPAPNAKLILYPQYPEVRFSGFLKGSDVDLSIWMDPYKKGRSEERMLVLAVTNDNEVLGYFIPPDFPLSEEIRNTKSLAEISVFSELSLAEEDVYDKRTQLLKKLLEIHEKGWIRSKRLNSLGAELPCSSPNCGGYTLEAELGITPNGYAEPDYLGWEVKQFGVKNFAKVMNQVITLMTPEPSGGIYADNSVAEFLGTYGYEDKRGRPDRINFGGVHRYDTRHNTTELTLKLDGFDPMSKKIIDPFGGIILEADNGEVAAKWHFSKLLEHWKKKHNQAVYIPSIIQETPLKSYFYGSEVMLGEGTDFSMLLSAIDSKAIYYDPGIKMEQASSEKPKIKRRSQFRIKSANLHTLYKTFTQINLV